jgi:hypothetical protein
VLDLPEEQQPQAKLAVLPRRVAHMLAIFTALLVIIHLAFSVNDSYIEWAFRGSGFLHMIFDLEGEMTLPRWYASSLLLLCSFTLTGVAAFKSQTGDRYRYHWAGLAVIFLGMSIEESVDTHGAVSREMTTIFDTGIVLTHPWVVPAAALTFIVGMLYIRFLRDLESRFRRLFVLAGGLYIGGALGLEFIEAAYDSVFGDDFVYILMVTIEEALEMAGAIVLLYAALTYLGALARRIHLDILPE